MFPTYDIHIVIEPEFFQDMFYAMFCIGGGIVGFTFFSIFKSNARWKKERSIKQKVGDVK